MNYYSLSWESTITMNPKFLRKDLFYTEFQIYKKKER